MPKVREVKMILRDAGASALIEEMDRDTDFAANGRRVRLEALANYCRTALKFFETGVLKQKKQLFRGPDLTRITGIMPDRRSSLRTCPQSSRLRRSDLQGVLAGAECIEGVKRQVELSCSPPLQILAASR